jgi:hypothetical protein
LAFEGSEVTKDAKKYWRLCKDKGELFRALEEAGRLNFVDDIMWLLRL